MKTRLYFFALLVFIPLSFLSASHVAHAGTYAAYSFSFPGIDTTGNTGITLDNYLSKKYLDALAADIYTNSYSDGDGPICNSGHCGYSYSCSSGGQCGGQAPYGDFADRVDREHAYWGQGEDQDHNYFKDGYPGQLMGHNNGFGAATALRACQVFSAADNNGVVDLSLTASYLVGDDNGDDGSYRNNSSFLGTGWDIFEANHHYSKLSGNDRNSGNAIIALTCNSAAKPNQTLTIGGGSSATVTAGQKVNLAWADNDIYGGAKQTCTYSTDNPDAPFVAPTPIPEPACTSVYLTKTGDPNQTSTLMSVDTDQASGYVGDPLYQYGCESVIQHPTHPAYCTAVSTVCDEKADNFCENYYTVFQCPVAMPSGTIPVTANNPGTYHYNFNCTNLAGSTNQQVTLTVTGTVTLPDLTSSALAVNPGSPVAGTAAIISATFANSMATSTGQAFSDAFLIDDDSDHGSYTTIATTSPALGPGGSNSRSISYKFPTAGTYYLMACADMNANGQGSISESLENNNCNSATWTTITVTNPPSPTISCTPSPTSQQLNTNVSWTAKYSGFNGTPTLSWTATGGNPATGGNVNPFVNQYSASGPYSAHVTGVYQAQNAAADCSPVSIGTCGGQVTGSITANPTRVATSSTSVIGWTGVQGVPAGGSCTIESTPSGNSSPPLGSGVDDSCTFSDGTWTTGPIPTQTKFCLVCGGQEVNCVVVDVDPAIIEN